ncbi:pilus assembly protein [Desulfonatronum sp. SC1]|uniref:pilus assembly protein n=1 Tax=Desulfonatronum sp. SC1 TaxID=2109626 RepID=UPI001304C5BD|nr:PilC/PilY family type IV pilus protein [Desulfonatronum sp. SC1]
MKKTICSILFLACLFCATSVHAAVSDMPLFLVAGAEPNVLFNLSIETPVGGAAYPDHADAATGCTGRWASGGNTYGVCYFPTQEYIGLFDPKKCYTYGDEYFIPAGSTNASHQCSGLFSGNFLNWATMTANDAFVWTMTGGDRVQDTESITVVQRARKYNNDSWFPHKLVNSTRNVAPSTIMPWNVTNVYVNNTDTGTGDTFLPRVTFGTTRAGTNLGLGTYNVRVQVCDSTLGLETNCQRYGSHYKPEGLIQRNAKRMRFAVTSYILDNSTSRHGGVLRSNMKFVGPVLPDGTDNTKKEYGTDGILINDPEGLAGTGGVSHSGIINYINMHSRYGYKNHDPISELYYESLRYLQNLAPTPEYFNITNNNQKGAFPVITDWEDPYINWCQRCFIVGVNDANPWYDKRLPGTFFTSQNFGNISLNAGSQDWGEPSNAGDYPINVREWTNKVGEIQGINNTYRKIGCTANNCDWNASNEKLIPGLGEVAGTYPYGPKQNSYYIAGLAFYANTQDMRPDLPNKQTVSTFMIDTQEFQANPLVGEMNMLWLVGKYGGFIDKNDNGIPDLVEEWDTVGDGEPDNYVLATNPAKLVEGLSASFLDVIRRTSSGASIATNTTRLGTETLIYQAKFNSDDWSGQIVAYQVNPDGSVGDVVWDTDDTGTFPPNHSARKIYTWNGTSGIEFTEDKWSSLHADQREDLQAGGSEAEGKQRLNWLRGDVSLERKNNGPFRNRSVLLGDIVNSDPNFVGTANFGYERLPVDVPGQDSYLAFREWSRDNRRKMLYVGANDGMLHAFDAETGQEQFAFIPKDVFPRLASLTDPDYTHKYYVDGSPFVGDAYIDGQWRTILVGTTGAGGRSVFALDVTNPDLFDETKVLWEFTHADLGYTIGQPVIARMQTGDWAVIFGNGFGMNLSAKLFIVNASTRALIKMIDTQAGGDNGLATPALLPDAYRTIDYAYAGDLKGNLWKFDLSHKSSIAQWKSAYPKTGSTPAPLFTARNAAGQVQPITAPMEIIRRGADHIILFGTGKYFEVGDHIVGNDPPIQSFYGILDNGSRITNFDRNDADFLLVEQEIIHEGIEEFETPDAETVSWPVRVVTDNPVDYTDKRGWYLDLVSPKLGLQGERVVSAALARSGRIIFTTLIPSEDPCEFGGTSWLMELDSQTGGRLSYSVFDLNSDGQFNQADYVTIVIDGKEVSVPVSGLQSSVGIIKTPAIISAVDVEYKFFGGSSGDIESIKEKGSEVSGRQSWRQLR